MNYLIPTILIAVGVFFVWRELFKIRSTLEDMNHRQARLENRGG